MTAYLRHGLLVVILVAVAGLSSGCNPLMLLPYVMGAEPRREPSLCQLADEQDPKKEVRVLILTYNAHLETRPELQGADTELSERTARQLQELAKFNQENLVIKNPRKVADYKSSHPNWHKEDLQKLGEVFKVDRVVYVEIYGMDLWEPGSGQRIFRGRTNLMVSVTDVNKPDDYPRKKELSLTYPKMASIENDMDTNPAQFREKFLNEVAKRVAWCLSAHPTADEFEKD